MIAEALDTLWTLGKAMAIWIVAFAIVATAVLYTLTAAVIATSRGLRRATRWAWHRTGPTWGRNRYTARRIARTRTYEEAA